MTNEERDKVRKINLKRRKLQRKRNEKKRKEKRPGKQDLESRKRWKFNKKMKKRYENVIIKKLWEEESKLIKGKRGVSVLRNSN